MDNCYSLYALAIGCAVAATTPASAETLTIYTAEEPAKLDPIRHSFHAEYPDHDINWVSDSTGVITARLLTEINAGDPRADLVLGTGTVTAHLVDELGYILPYAPKGLERIHPKFRDSNNPPHWIAVESYQSAICFNTIEAKAKGLPAPSSWRDLVDPIYKGQIVMPDPNSSGTGLLSVFGWMDIFGEDASWDYMDALHRNIASYTHSGSKPCSLAASGEYVIGLSYTFAAAAQKGQGAPIDILLPEEGVGSDLGATFILKGTENADAAKAFLDWYISPSGIDVYSQFSPVLAVAGVPAKAEFYPDDLREKMLEPDVVWQVQNRERVLKEWSARYSSNVDKQ